MADHPVLLSFGHGYSARALARRLLEQGWQIIGTTRSQDKAASMQETGAEPLIWPGGGDLSAALARATHLLISAGPTEEGDPVLNDWRTEIAERAAQFEWVGYLSTTGVYGDRQGGWVDEGSALEPTTRRGRWRKSAESAWQALAEETGLPLHIFRLAGIYGPGRGPFSKVRAGSARRIIKPNQVFSRIHVEDIATVLEASIAQPRPGAIYNVCDDEAAPPEDVIAHAAELLGLPTPPAIAIEDADMSDMARSFYAESKRVSNRLVKDELSVDLAYPSYREGLAALLAQENAWP